MAWPDARKRGGGDGGVRLVGVGGYPPISGPSHGETKKPSNVTRRNHMYLPTHNPLLTLTTDREKLKPSLAMTTRLLVRVVGR